jgi:hypothetical protein
MSTAIIMLINASVHVQPYVLMSTVEIMTPAGAHVVVSKRRRIWKRVQGFYRVEMFEI